MFVLESGNDAFTYFEKKMSFLIVIKQERRCKLHCGLRGYEISRPKLSYWAHKSHNFHTKSSNNLEYQIFAKFCEVRLYIGRINKLLRPFST